MSLRVQQFQKGLGYFPQAAPGKCFIFLARYLTSGSGSSEATRGLSLPDLGMLLADPGTAAPIPALLADSWCLIQHRLVPCFSLPAAPSRMRNMPRTHTEVLRGCSAPAAVALVLRWCLSPGGASGMANTPHHPCTKPGMMAERPWPWLWGRGPGFGAVPSSGVPGW